MQSAPARPSAKAPDAGVGSAAASSPSPSPSASGADKPAHDVVAGAMARAASQSTIHPLDTMKVRMQAGGIKGKAPPAASSSVSSSSSSKAPLLGGTAGMAAGLQRSLAEVGSLYKGVVSAATGAGIIIGAYFAFYSTSKRFLREKTEWKDGQIAFVSGAAAAVGSGVVKVPIAVCIRSVQAGVYPDVFAAARSIVKAAGARGLFTGYVPTLMEDVPDMAVKFAVYETMRLTHASLNNNRQPSTLEDLLMGGTAGAAAAAATTPLDVIKTRMMCTASSRPTIMTAARSVMAEGDGLRAFFRGVGPRALSNGINSAVFFCFFEAIRRVLIQNQQQKQAALQRQPLSLQQQEQEEEEQQRLNTQTRSQLQMQQVQLQLQQQQPVLALDSSVGGAGSSSRIHVGRQQHGQQAGTTGSGRLACLSLALPIAERR